MAADHEQQGEPERYCLGCGYPLFGLPEPRCPECGRAFDPVAPNTFAVSPKQPWITSLWRTQIGKAGIVFLALLLLLAFVEGGLDYGSRSEACPQCGARSRVKHLVFYGLGGDYGRVTSEGPVSQFIQRQNGVPCLHRWQLSSFSDGGIFLGRRGSGQGLALPTPHVAFLESAFPRLGEVLQSKADADPQFVAELKAVLAGNDDNRRGASFEGLFEEARIWAQSRDAEYPTAKP